MTTPIVQVNNLGVEFKTDDGVVRAVNDVSFDLAPGETLGIVGESGSGKSVTNLAIMGLVPQPPGKVVSGRALFRGDNLLEMDKRSIASIRGNRIAMIFQDPMTALNPFLTIEEQMTEVTCLHLGHSRAEAVRHAIDMLERVGIPSASKRLYDYPHQFSGGMRQRVMIAIALSCQPDVLIADEPTTAQILELMQTLQREEGTSIILITHDLGIVASSCHRVMVMYAGRIVERREVGPLFSAPRHPYTLGLLESVPRWDRRVDGLLHAIDGQPPDLTKLPQGCAFADRCPYQMEQCLAEIPPLTNSPDGGAFACFANLDEIREQEVKA